MTEKRGLPESLHTLMRQLVQQKQIHMAGTVLFVYFQRHWQLDEEKAAYYTVRYFRKYFPVQWEKEQQKEQRRS